MIAGGVLACVVAVLILSRAEGSGPLAHASEPSPTVQVFLPAVCMEWSPYACPGPSGAEYDVGTAFPHDTDDPVRPAVDHADKNLALRGMVGNSDPGLRRELVAYDSRTPIQPPQLATLFSPAKVPELAGFYRVHHWQWAPTPEPGIRSDPITSPSVTALGLATMPGEQIHVPESGHDLGGGYEVLVLFADQDSVTLRYTRDDSVAPSGYTLHVDGLCTDPALLALYNELDDPSGSRYEYPSASYSLPILRAGQPVGTARGSELIVAIVDTGTFQDPRSCEDWWQVRPGYAGSCPPYD